MSEPVVATTPLFVKVLSPTRALYEGEAISVSASNKVGPFDILSGHTNFFTILTASDVVVRTGKDTHTFPIAQGVMKVHDNTVTLYIDIGL